MKRWLFGTFTAITVLATAAGTAAACPRGEGDTRPVRPIVDNVSFQASELLERAARMDGAAMSREQSARTKEMQADALANRARALRSQVSLVGFSDEQDVLSIADELALRAASMRTRAAEDRAQAIGLRMQARVLRERAAQLVRVGNGGRNWRNKRGPVRDFAPPPPSATVL
jgi:hypothetical protein